MSLVVTKVGNLFAAELIGADLTGEPSGELVQTVRDALTEYGVLVIREADISDQEQVRFGRRFFSLELPPLLGVRGLRIARELYDVSNLSAEGEIEPADAPRRSFNSDKYFHIDSSFNSFPTTWSMLSAREIPPEGGDTEFIDMREVYAALDDDTKAQIENLSAEHCFVYGLRLGGWEPSDTVKARFPPVVHKLVKTAPDGRKMIFAGAHCGRIIDWPEAESRALLKRIIDLAREPRFRYVHHWRLHDLLIWDNRSVMHRAVVYDSFKYRRDMRQCRLADAPDDVVMFDPLPAQAGAQSA